MTLLVVGAFLSFVCSKVYIAVCVYLFVFLCVCVSPWLSVPLPDEWRACWCLEPGWRSRWSGCPECLKTEINQCFNEFKVNLTLMYTRQCESHAGASWNQNGVVYNGNLMDYKGFFLCCPLFICCCFVDFLILFYPFVFSWPFFFLLW